jgi:hypothetical protein
MNARAFAGAGAIAVVALFLASVGFSQAQAPSQLPASPEWFVLPPSGAGGGPAPFPEAAGADAGRWRLAPKTRRSSVPD